MKSLLTIYGVMQLLLLPGNALALSSENPACSEVKSIERPFYPNEFNSPKFNLHFKHIQRSPDLPTIVFLPGGPGATSIYFGMSDETLNVLLPKNYNVVLTDPRGVGCNADLPERTDEKFYTSSNLTSDVIAIVRHLHLKNYVLYGHSYGTLLATSIASRIAATDHAKPRAVVLEGVVGKALRSNDEIFGPYAGYKREWKRVLSSLPETLRARFTTSELPLGLSGIEWGSYIVSLISSGKIFDNQTEPDLRSSLLILESGTESEIQKLRAEVRQAGAKTPRKEFMRLYKPIWCRELATSDNTDMALIAGELIGHQNPDICKDYEFSEPYDSRDYQLSIPVFYIQGENDPATVYEQAIYHFDNQPNAKRFFLSIPFAGHSPMASLTDCREYLWRSVVSEGNDIGKAASQCGVKPKVLLGK